MAIGLICDSLLKTFYGRDLICRHSHFPRFLVWETPVSLSAAPGDVRRRIRRNRRLNIRTFVQNFFGFPIEKQNYWRVQQRMNKTFRPQARSSFCIEERAGPPYDDEDGSEEEAAEIERTGGTVNFFVCGCKDVDQGKILLFVKFFDEVKNSLEYVAHIHAEPDKLLVEVLRANCPTLFVESGPKLMVWEEICPKDSENDTRPFVEMEDKNLCKTIVENELTSGDLLVIERVGSSSFRTLCTTIKPTIPQNDGPKRKQSQLESHIRRLYDSPTCSDIVFKVPLSKDEESKREEEIGSTSSSFSPSSSPSPSSAPSSSAPPTTSSSSPSSGLLSSTLLLPSQSPSSQPVPSLPSSSTFLSSWLPSQSDSSGRGVSKEKAKSAVKTVSPGGDTQYRTFYAHKVVLSQYSYFRALFTSGLKESNLSEMTLSHQSAGVFECILKYIYFFASQSELPSEEKFEELMVNSGASIDDLFESAHLYDIPELVELCKRHMVNSLSLGTWLPTLLLLHKYMGEQHIQGVMDFVIRHIREIMKQPDFCRLGLENPQLFQLLGNHLDTVLKGRAESPPRKRLRHS